MILKGIYLYPDLTNYRDEVVHPFRDQSRSICNFLERSIKPVRFFSEGFKRICFVAQSEPREDCFINSSKVLIVEIPFDEIEYLKKEKKDLNKYFSKLIKTGIIRASKEYKIPEIELKNALRNFEMNEYKNNWLFKKKCQKTMGIEYSISCELTIDRFYSRLIINKSNKIIFNKVIIETEPDEIIFSPMLKDVKFFDGYFYVLNKMDEVIFKISYNDI